MQPDLLLLKIKTQLENPPSGDGIDRGKHRPVSLDLFVDLEHFPQPCMAREATTDRYKIRLNAWSLGRAPWNTPMSKASLGLREPGNLAARAAELADRLAMVVDGEDLSDVAIAIAILPSGVITRSGEKSGKADKVLAAIRQLEDLLLMEEAHAGRIMH